MVRNDVVAAIAAPRTGEPIWSKPKRTRLSRPANKNAAARGNRRSRVRQLFVEPFHESAMMPQTMANVPKRFVAVGRSLRKNTANRVANKGVLFVRHAVIEAPSRCIPLNMKNRATPGTKTPTKTKIRLAGAKISWRLSTQNK